MAIIDCPECGKKVSDKAENCPNCGFPIQQQEVFNNNGSNILHSKRSRNWILFTTVAILVIGAVGFGYWLLLKGDNTENEETAEVKITPEFIEKVHQYDELYPFSEGLAAVTKDGKRGFINTNGDLVIPCQFFGTGDFSEGIAPVWDKNFVLSFIDRNGNIVIETNQKIDKWSYFGNQLDETSTYWNCREIKFNNGVCEYTVQTGDGGENFDIATVYIDKNGQNIAPPVEMEKKAEICEYEIFEENYKYGLKDKNGSVIIPPNYNTLSLPSNGVVLATQTEYRDFESHSEELNAQAEGIEINRTIYGYISLNGISTFTTDDYDKLSEFRNMIEDEKRRKEQARIEEEKRQEEERRKEQARIEEERRKEQARIEEEKRQEEKRRQGTDVIISMTADVNSLSQLINKQCNIGDVSLRWDQLISRNLRVPNGKVLIFRHVEFGGSVPNNRLDFVRLFVYDKNGYERGVYEARSCGEFPIFEGESVKALIHFTTAQQGLHLDVRFHFVEKDKDLY